MALIRWLHSFLQLTFMNDQRPSLSGANDPSSRKDPVGDRRRPVDPPRAVSLRTKRNLLVTVNWEGQEVDLSAVISGLEQFRLAARAARRNGLDLQQFLVFMQARSEADRLAREAQVAKAACDQLLKKRGASPAGSLPSPFNQEVQRDAG